MISCLLFSLASVCLSPKVLVNKKCEVPSCLRQAANCCPLTLPGIGISSVCNTCIEVYYSSISTDGTKTDNFFFKLQRSTRHPLCISMSNICLSSTFSCFLLHIIKTWLWHIIHHISSANHLHNICTPKGGKS